MDRDILQRYARLIARSGINVIKGQEVVIRTEPAQVDFVEMLVRECYLAGASKVDVEWECQRLTRLDIEFQHEDVLGRVEAWEEERLRGRVRSLPACIYLDSEDPDGLSGVDLDKWTRARQARYKITKPYRDAMENGYQWCIAAVPGKAWAAKMFPELDADEAEEKLWELILKCSRAMEDDPIEAWRSHNEKLARRCDKLNSLKLRRLIYKSESTGTDFSVGLIPQMLFTGGADRLPGKNVAFNANIPSEEVFTTPMKGDAEGVVYATMPLSYRGVLIENFSLRFEKGRVVELHAEKNEDELRRMVSVDEGASMLGECALVPFSSPIRECGVLFYNTLFDENASCHLALGSGYSSCLRDFEKYSVEDARRMGVNDSMIHEDFMIGSPDLNITGITSDGSSVLLFSNGEWVDI